MLTGDARPAAPLLFGTSLDDVAADAANATDAAPPMLPTTAAAACCALLAADLVWARLRYFSFKMHESGCRDPLFRFLRAISLLDRP